MPRAEALHRTEADRRILLAKSVIFPKGPSQQPMPIPGLTKAIIKEHTAEGSYERGESYFEEGAVQHIEDSDQTITARVKGSYYIPYAVHVSYNGQGVTEVECTCPYFEGSWCKHIVATLLVVLEQSGGVSAASPELRERLQKLDRDHLIAVIEQLAGADPEPLRRVERALRAIEEKSRA